MSAITDECLDTEMVRSIHFRVGRGDLRRALSDLGERESALMNYVFAAGVVISDQAQAGGVSPADAKVIEDEVMFRMLVLAECISCSHFELWRDLMGDEPTDEGSEQNE